jgi:hypothetical protein
VNRTLQLVGKSRLLSAGTETTSSAVRLSTETLEARRIEALANSDQTDPKLGHRTIVFLLSILSISAAIGIGLAVLNPGGFSRVRAILSAFIHEQGNGSTSP